MNRIPTLIESIESELTRYRRHTVWAVTFSKDLEARYFEEVIKPLTVFHVRVLIAMIILFNMLLLGDWLIMHKHFTASVLIHGGMFTPVALLLTRSVKYSNTKLKKECAIGLVAIIAILASLFLGFGDAQSFSFRIEPVIVSILVLQTCVVRVSPVISAVVASVAVVASTAAMIWYYHLDVGYWGPNAAVVTLSAVLMLTANYLIVRSIRLSYLLQLRSELQSQMLSHANKELRRISERDELTGLNNRYRYERFINEVLERSIRHKRPIAMLMVDVDHFKITNDQYGHLYGDRVLQRIGSLIQQGLRGEDDFAARYGGEEFVVVLPNTELAAAVTVAERIRTLVQVAGSPAPSRGSGPLCAFTTVSCGVASMIPVKGDTAESLLEIADRAMYRAKAEGRNRTCTVYECLTP